MRVVAGKYRGKPLASPKSNKVRPTADIVKQALFTKLQFFIEGKSVLDLFSGSGGLGIEALSRGASEVVFVDKDYQSVRLVKQNLASVNENALVIHSDCLIALKRFNRQFDLILLDPPYASGLYKQCLQIISEKNMLTNEGVIVCEHNIDEKIDEEYFEIFDEKRYGTVYLTYLKRKD